MTHPERLVILVGEQIGATNLARLRDQHPTCDFRLCLDDDSFTETARAATVIFSKRFPASAMGVAARLRWVQAGTAGVNQLLGYRFAQRGILLTNARGAHGVPMAEQVLAMMLAFATHLHLLIRGQSKQVPLRETVIHNKFELAGQTVCILGLGDIGGTLARKCKALDMQVIGVRRTNAVFDGIDRQVTPERLREVLPLADHVALCLPLTSATTAIIGEEELRAMKETAYIYNVGRGASIAPRPLIRALQAGGIAGAGLDVTNPEPLAIGSPLWTMSNVILAQHTSGSSPHNADRITTIFSDNLARFLRGEPLRNLVDAENGY